MENYLFLNIESFIGKTDKKDELVIRGMCMRVIHSTDESHAYIWCIYIYMPGDAYEYIYKHGHGQACKNICLCVMVHIT